MWGDVADPAWGSAAPARFWVALEQPGPWGRLAFVQSRLDPVIGQAFEQRCARAGGRALLMRGIGDHQMRRGVSPATRCLFVSGGMTEGRPFLLTGQITDPGLVLDLPTDALASGDVAALQEALPALMLSPVAVLLVCTNAKRDACCAVLGRPVALEAGAARPGRVWECSHTGGHRFSATGVLLPTGATLARLDTDLAVATIDAADDGLLGGEVLNRRNFRGLSHHAPVAQAADAAVREVTGEQDPSALTLWPLNPAETTWAVTHRDGRHWQVQVTRYTDPQPRRNSCITAPVPTQTWHTSVEEF